MDHSQGRGHASEPVGDHAVGPRVAIVSDWYPSTARPFSGIFVEDRAVALQRRIPVAVVAPRRLSWRSVRSWRARLRSRRPDPVPVLRPPVILVPRAGRQHDRAYEAALARSLESAARIVGSIDLIDAHVVLPAGLAAVRVGKSAGIPVVLTEHSSPFSVHLATRCGRRRVEEALEAAARVVAVGPGLRDEIRAVADVRVDVLGNLVADRFFAVPPPVRTEAVGPRLLAVGFLVPQKRFDLLLRAFAVARIRLPPLELVIVGEGPERPALVALGAELGLGDRVRLEPMIDRAGLSRWLGWADAVVSSSDHESFGLFVAEALAAGRPVVVTDSGGPRAFVDEDLGIVVPRGDASALAAGIEGLPAFIDRFDPAAARRRMAARFGREAFVERMLALYDDVLAGQGPGHA